jgi:haloalkane dehalogenase
MVSHADDIVSQADEKRPGMEDALKTKAPTAFVLFLAMSLTPLGCTLRYGDALKPGTPASKVSWINPGEYPFQSRFLDVDGGKLHYLDEGKRDAPTVVFVHGTPTWSFLYRKLIAALAPTFRCIALDHIGFGLSSKPGTDAFAHTPEAHSKNLRMLLKHLDVKDALLVIHDLGGPIGFSAALEEPERIAQVAVLNTFAWSLKDDEQVGDVDSFLKSGVGQWLYLNRNISPEMLLPDAFGEGYQLSEEVHRHYTHPFPDEDSRDGLLQIGLSLRGGADFHAALWSRKAELKDKVKLILFGLADPFFGPPVYDKWRHAFPEAKHVPLFEVGHFPQEEAPKKVAVELSLLLEAMRESQSQTQLQNGASGDSIQSGSETPQGSPPSE